MEKASNCLISPRTIFCELQTTPILFSCLPYLQPNGFYYFIARFQNSTGEIYPCRSCAVWTGSSLLTRRIFHRNRIPPPNHQVLTLEQPSWNLLPPVIIRPTNCWLKMGTGALFEVESSRCHLPRWWRRAILGADSFRSRLTTSPVMLKNKKWKCGDLMKISKIYFCCPDGLMYGQV